MPTIYCEKGGELLARLQRPCLRFTDSQGVDGVSNRLPVGRKKESRYGSWGFYAHPPVTGTDLANFGWAVFNAPSSPHSYTAVGAGVAPPSPIADLTLKNGTGGAVVVWGADNDFAPFLRSYYRDSFWANSWLDNVSLYFGELRVNLGANGNTNSNLIVSGRAGTTIHSSAAISDASGTRGNYTWYESPSAVATGTGASDVSIYRQTAGPDETGLANYMLLRTIRHPNATTKYGEVSIGWGGATLDMLDDEAGQSGDARKITDAYLDQILTMLPIEGDYGTGGKSGKVTIMLGQNGYSAGNQAQLETWIDNICTRIRSSLTRVGKGTSDVLIELVCQWDTTTNLGAYNPTTEQVKYDEMDTVFRAYAEAHGDLHDKVAYTPLGQEVRERHGDLTNWAATYLAGGGDYIHPNAAGALYFPTVEVDLYELGDAPSSGGAVQRSSVRVGIGI